MLKSHNVVMLFTTKAPELGQLCSNKVHPFFIWSQEHIDNNVLETLIEYKLTKVQHLYIISDEEIKEGDWYLVNINTPEGKTNLSIHRYEEDKIGGKKIIATTDNSLQISDGISDGQSCPLGISNDDGLTYISLPQIPESFIKAYVKAQGINEVQVEFEEYMTEGWVPTYNNPDNHNLDKEAELDYLLKLKDDNTIIIHQAKTYSLKDMEKSFNAGIKCESEKPWTSFNYWIRILNKEQ